MSDAHNQNAAAGGSGGLKRPLIALAIIAVCFVIGYFVIGALLAPLQPLLSETLAPAWKGLEYSPVGDFVAVSGWAFPGLESAHVIAVVLVVGTIAIMDLRLLGLASRDCAVTELSRDTLPWTWAAFIAAVITGGMLFTSNASSYAINPFFQWKMILIVAAGVNMAIFHFFTWKSVHSWDSDCAVPLAGKVAAMLSLIFWVIVVFCGRLIGFTLGSFF